MPGGTAGTLTANGVGGTGFKNGGNGFGGGGGTNSNSGGGGGYNGGDGGQDGGAGTGGGSGGDSFFNSTRAIGAPTNTAGNNPGNGSVLICWATPPCSITNISAGNFSACNFSGGNSTFTADVTVTFANPPATGNLDLTGDGTASVAVGSLNSSTSHTFPGVTLPADGGTINLTATFSDLTTCTFTGNAGTAIMPCPPCSITNLSAGNFSACTFSGGNSTFTADVTVTFANPPATGNLDLTGDGTASFAVGSLNSSTSHTFSGVTLPADGGTINLTATFSDLTTCTFTANAGTAQYSCSPFIPTMNQWGLLIFALLILNIGAGVIVAFNRNFDSI